MSNRVLSVWYLLVLTSGLVHGQLLETADGGDTDSYTLPQPVILKDGDTFEYIVVGAGASGCAVAARLALAGFNVLLVEAGADPGLLSKIPAASTAQVGTSVDWQYPTIPNNISCLASRGRACRYSSGKCLGGSTSINYMLYTRGNRQDYDYDIPGWSWKQLEPYFLRFEGLQVLDQLPRSSTPYHNTSGIVKLEFFDDPQNEWQSRLLKGYEYLKFPPNQDVNAVSQIGISRLYGYVYEGERMSTARAYLGRKDVQRKLKVATNTLCAGVIIDKKKVTRGVTVLPEGALKPLKLFATKEVILSAGTIRTPQILMLSGIGPADHLKEMGIPVRANLPVGDNMSDHVLPLLVILVDRGVKIKSYVGNLLRKIGEVLWNVTLHVFGILWYSARQDGPLASVGLMDVNAFANTLCYNTKQRQLENNSSCTCELPTLQVTQAYVDRNAILLAKPFFQQAINLNDLTISQLANANLDNALIVMSPIVLFPHSRGTIRLATKDPSDPPAIYANYLSDERDVDEMLRSIRIIQQLVQTPPFKEQNAKLLHLKFPGCPRGGEGYWRCYVKHMTYAVFHAVGTCSLDKVVDAKLKVKGIKGLRVADISVLPRIPRGNTEAGAIAIGEKLADLLVNTSRSNC